MRRCNNFWYTISIVFSSENIVSIFCLIFNIFFNPSSSLQYNYQYIIGLYLIDL